MEPFPTLQPEVMPRPYGFFEALMQGYEGNSVEEMLPLRESIARAFDVLDEYERYVFDASHYRGLSVRSIAREINRSKSSVYRARQRGLKKLAAKLIEDPLVREWL